MDSVINTISRNDNSHLFTVTEFTTDPDPAPVRESKPEAEEKQQSEEEAE